MILKPLISINIPIFNCEDYLLRCLNSVKEQTYKNIEIVLVNDCTKDNSVIIANTFIMENPELKVKLIQHEENQGLSVVRNTGIDASVGDYIFFLDSDDTITKDCIEELVNTANDTEAEVVIGQNKWINTFNNTEKDFGFPTLAPKDFYSDSLSILEAYCKDFFPTTSWNKLFKTNFIKENKIYFVPKLYAQDELWFFHLMLKTNTLAINRKITYDYYLHKDSVIFNRTKKNFENYITILFYFDNEYRASESVAKKRLIKRKIVKFKNLIMVLQWKAMRADIEYWKLNYKRMKQVSNLSFFEYLGSDFSFEEKKFDLLQNLPTNIGYHIFKKRYSG